MAPFLAVALALTTGAAGLPKVAVLDLQTSGIDPVHAPLLTEVLTAEFSALGMFEAISGDDIRAVLGHEAERQLLSCDDTGCLADIGGALGADLILASRVGLLGGSYVLTVKLVNVRTARTEARVYDTVSGELDALVALIRTSIRRLGQEVVGGVEAADAAQGPSTAGETGAESRTDASAPPPATDPTSGARASRGLGAGPVVLWSAGGVGLLAGGYFALEALGIHRDVTQEHFSGPATLILEGQANQSRANASFVLGGGAIAAGLVWWMLRPKKESALVLVPIAGPALGAGAVVTW